jgi:hypothetical protein
MLINNVNKKFRTIGLSALLINFFNSRIPDTQLVKKFPTLEGSLPSSHIKPATATNPQ